MLPEASWTALKNQAEALPGQWARERETWEELFWCGMRVELHRN